MSQTHSIMIQPSLLADGEEIVHEEEENEVQAKYYTHICCHLCNQCCVCGGDNPNDVMDMDTEPYSYPDSYYESFIQDEIEEADNLSELERASRDGWITDEEIEELTAQDFINLLYAEYDRGMPSLTELWDPSVDGAWDGAVAA